MDEYVFPTDETSSNDEYWEHSSPKPCLSARTKSCVRTKSLSRKSPSRATGTLYTLSHHSHSKSVITVPLYIGSQQQQCCQHYATLNQWQHPEFIFWPPSARMARSRHLQKVLQLAHTMSMGMVSNSLTSTHLRSAKLS